MLECTRNDERQAELFFTEGTSALVQARRAVARYSIPRSYIRSRKNKRKFEETSSIHEEAQRNRFREFLEKEISVLSSQVGDVRPLTACRFSGDHELLATAAFSGTLKIWDTSTGTLKETLTDAHPTRVHGLAWRPGWTSHDKPGLGALASCDAAGSILLWSQSVEDSAWRPVRSFLGHEDRVNRVSFHPSGRYLASTSHDETWRSVFILTLSESPHLCGGNELMISADGGTSKLARSCFFKRGIHDLSMD